MTSWYSKRLEDAIIAQTELDLIETIFAEKYQKAARPPEMAVFTRYDAEGGLHCKVTAYFSPAAKDIARRIGAKPCPRPHASLLELFVGEEESWSVLFSKE